MNKKNKAILLDRDGVINELVISPEEGIVDSPNSSDQLKIIKNSIKAMKILANLGYKLVIISNQPGIAKGYYDTSEFFKIKRNLEDELTKNNIILSGQYYCLHHPNAKMIKYRKKCQCRKPGTKLFFDAIKEHNIDTKKSFLIGDGITDMQLAKKVRCRAIFIGNINSAVTRVFHEKKINPFYVSHDLLEAANYIRKLEKRQILT
ncbi:MAG: D-glycero-alpha-D-manno-heptose-1,7-bisphosphate 7-phosphatase [Nitrosotalea sp.]